jgi:hypothetical protein
MECKNEMGCILLLFFVMLYGGNRDIYYHGAPRRVLRQRGISA